MKHSFLLSIILIVIALHSFGQEAPKVKFGKVSEEELNMRAYAPDTTAEAVILFDNGESTVNYDVTKSRFMLNFERFVRIKILKQNGTSWGNFKISLYSFNLSKEDLRDVDGVTFNMVNGKIEKLALKKEAIFQERENKYWEVARISLPSVKVGSVIDLRYNISSPILWNLQPWKFQYPIPVKWSQVLVSYPEYFRYNKSSMGYYQMNSQKESTKTENINYTVSVETQGSAFSSGGRRDLESRTISYTSNVFEYSAKDVPALKEEPYCTTMENFTTRLKFELSNVDFTKIGGEFKNYTNTWETICTDLIDDEDFGGQINGGNFVEDLVAELIKGKTSEKEKAIAINSYIQKNIKWDEFNSYYTSKSLKRTLNEKKGNCADINLLLTLMLRKAGLKADPVLLSTRSHGIISPVYPTLSDCNYIIVCATVDSKPFFMDATEPSLPAGELPFRCMNGNGVLVSKTNPTQIPIPTTPSISSTSAILDLKDGKMSGNIMSFSYGKEAFDFREGVKAAGGSQAFFDKIKNSTNEIEYQDYSYENLDSLYKPVRQKYGITLKNDSEDGAPIIYVNPIVQGRMQKNPFTSPTRDYPVDFGVPSNEKFVLSMGVPSGYKVEELPKNSIISLGENGAKFSYNIGISGDRVVLNMKLFVDKALFLPSEYADMKNFFDMIVAKQAEQIVLKKIEGQ